jgi:hypothetical protein
MIMRSIVLTLFLIQTAAAADFSFPADAPTAAQLDSYFAAKGSNLAGHGNKLIEAGRKYDIDPRLVAAVAGAETSLGNNVCTPFNAWNWFYKQTCPPSKFSSYDEAIENVTKYLRHNYINKGYTSLALIRAKYCTSDCENWIPLATKFREEMSANAMQASSAPTTVPGAPSASPAAQLFGLPLFAIVIFVVLIPGVIFYTASGKRR